jgi:catalase
MSDWEKQHIAEAFQFELGKVQRPHIREGVVANLASVDHALASEVAEGLGLPAPPQSLPNHGRSSPALSQADQPQSVATRKVAVLAADGADAASLEPVLRDLREQGATCEILAPHGGELDGRLQVDRALVTMASVLYDAVLVAGGNDNVETLRGNGAAVRYVAEAYKHAKPVAAMGEGVELLREAPLNDARISDNGLVNNSGVVTLAGSAERRGARRVHRRGGRRDRPAPTLRSADRACPGLSGAMRVVRVR